jgi:hypothetical protein
LCQNYNAKTRHIHYSKVLDRIRSHGRGWVFTPAHLADLGTRNAVASALKRFKAAGTIRQLARGLYDYPVQDSVLGTVAPSADAIARALAARDAIRLQPSGDDLRYAPVWIADLLRPFTESSKVANSSIRKAQVA